MIPSALAHPGNLLGDFGDTVVMPQVMGVVNVSADSFCVATPNLADAIARVDQLLAAGVDIIDIGGEATNPSVNLASHNRHQAFDRVLSLVEAISARCDVTISVDTSDASLMREAVKLGAGMINDQRGLSESGALKAAVDLAVPVCIMHSFQPQRHPGSSSPAELMQSMLSWFDAKITECLAAGMSRNALILDPGFGQGHYGKNTVENFYLLAHLQSFAVFDLPILVGWSRKSMLGDILGGRSVDQRVSASLASALLAVQQGAQIIRCHDVQETKDVLTVYEQFLRHLA